MLGEYPKGLPAAEIRRWLNGLVDGVAYLHDHGIVHRDLKPANLFLEEGIVKIGDYGLSKSIAQSRQPDSPKTSAPATTWLPRSPPASTTSRSTSTPSASSCSRCSPAASRSKARSTGEVLMKHLTAQPDLSPLAEPYRSIVARALAKDPARRPDRIHDLLPPGDAPEPPDIRIIGKSGAPAEAPPAAFAAMAPPVATPDEVHHIPADDNVLYIGPDTMPPGHATTRASRAAARRAAAAAKKPGKKRGWLPIGRRQKAVAALPVVVAPPPLPDSRGRLAELAGSMVVTAPLAALASAISLPAYDLLGVDLPKDPLQLAFLFTMLLLGTWSVLIPAKIWETRRPPITQRRVAYLLAGMLLGAVGMGLSVWTHINPSPPLYAPVINDGLNVGGETPADFRSLLMFSTYFGLAFAAIPWWKITDRDRDSRFRFWPVIQVGVIATLVGLIWPSPHAWAVLLVVIIATVAQVVSPWDSDAALHAQLVRRRVAA